MREYLFFWYFWCNFVVNCSKLGLWVYFNQAILTWKYMFIFTVDQSQGTYPVPWWESCSLQNRVCVLRCIACWEPQSGFVPSVHYTKLPGGLHASHQLRVFAVVSLASQLSKCFQSTHYLFFKEQKRTSLQRGQRAIAAYCDTSKSKYIDRQCHQVI